MKQRCPNIWTIFLAVAALLLLSFFTPAHPATVTICKPIKAKLQLPKSGKCIKRRVGRYTVTICG